MAKGIKMVSAYKRKGNSGVVLEIQNLSKEDNGSLFCEDPRCRTRIEYNSGYTRHATNTVVAPYLKLAKDCFHELGCKNSISGAVKVFVSDSNDVENIPNIFDELADGSFTLRLNLLEKSKSQLNDLVDKVAKEPKNEQLGKDYIKTERKLASYCKSAAGIARLRNLILEGSDIAEFESLVKIQYKDKQVKWKDFFYDDERYHVLYKRLLSGRIDHPVALRVTAKLTRSSTIEKYPVSVQCYAQREEDCSYIPWINLNKELATLELQSDESYIVLASVNASENGRYKNLKVAVNNKQQIVPE